MKKSKIKNILISGYYGFDNFGDETILSVLIEKLKQIGTNVRVFSKNPKKTAGLYDVKTTYSFCPRCIIFELFRNDILISGGGSLLQDVTSIKSLIYYLFIINMALFFKKKVIIFAQGIGPINNKFGALLTKKTLQKCTLVTVRDRKSRLLLHKWGIEADLVCDPLFDLNLLPYSPSNRVGVQLRSFKTLKNDLLQQLAEKINKEFPDKLIEIMSFQDSLDLDVCKRFENILKAMNPGIKTNITSNQTSLEVLKTISELDYMIAMRFHANLIAIKYGIKTLAISYDIKVEKLAEEAEIPCVLMNNGYNLNELFAQLKAVDSQKLIEYSSTKHFDWSKIEELVNN